MCRGEPRGATTGLCSGDSAGHEKARGWCRVRTTHAWLVVAAATLACAGAGAAELEVGGLGWWRDREVTRTLNVLVEPERRPVLDANAIEDASVILWAMLAEEGFQEPVIEIRITTRELDERRHVFDPTFARPLPRPLAAAKVAFAVTPGVRSYIAAVEFSGLSALDPKKARSHFRIDAPLITTRRTNAYSPPRVNRGAGALLEALRQLGFSEARVRARTPGQDKGAVTLHVEVVEGSLWRVDQVRYQGDEGEQPGLPETGIWVGQPWTPTLEQDIREAVRHAYYRMGYPDVGVHVEAEVIDEDGIRKDVEVVVTVVPGPRVVVGQVLFEGNRNTRAATLDRRVQVRPGDPLDPLALERARFRISRLGVFEAVDLKYEPSEGSSRDPVFSVSEAPRIEVNLLMGYGSYVQLRGGLEVRQMNLFGRAHQSRLELVQSMKSSTGDYTYTVPELFGETLDGTVKLFGLQREEIAFIRQEFGSTVTLRRRLPASGGMASAGYTLQALRNRRNALSTQATDERQLLVASMTFGISGDRRDNPLRPRRGHHWHVQAEAADPMLGGEATYQRFEASGGYHTRWGGERWLHAGLTHGLLTTLGSGDDSTIPINKRFYPGGDSSIRGYQSGEAAPRGADGRFVGAKAYALLNVEIEQALTQAWSLVAFADALGTAVVLREYPFDEVLYSAGLGLRYQTLIGPVRLEYGRNLNPRPGDPNGTWHLSIGFPF